MRSTPTVPSSLNTRRRSAKDDEHGPLDATGQALARLRAAVRLLLLGGLGVALTLALASFDLRDAAFSTTGDGEAARNWLGAGGAWVADVVLMALGFSAWWLVAAWALAWLRTLAGLLRGAQGAAAEPHPAAPAPSSGPLRSPSLQRAVGLAGVVAASCALEFTRLYTWEAALPGSAGGVLGALLGPASTALVGFTLSGVLWIALMVAAMQWAFGLSWVALADALGAWALGLGKRQAAQRELAEDVRLGELAQAERQVELQALEQEVAVAPPVPIAKPPPPTPSKRAVQEQQPTLFAEMSDTKLPPLHLLDKAPQAGATVDAEALAMTSRLIEKKLADFGVQVKVVEAQPGPVITRYEIEPATGVKGVQVVNLAKDLARSLSLTSIRVVETVPGKNLMALELPNAKRQTIRLTEILSSQVYHASDSKLTLALGKDIIGQPMVADLGKMPHCLVAGTTGAGKSVGINGMILSLLYKAEPRDVRLILIDPKMLELSVYEGIPHLLAPVVTDMKQAAHALNWAVGEMDRRYKLMSTLGVRSLDSYNRKIDEAAASGQHLTNPFSLTPDAPEPLEVFPRIVIVIDELADLMMVVGKKVEELIARLAQKARAAGVHLILATQRPSVDVITGLIKANVPTRISFQVSSKIDSRTILDQMGAEALLGMGDMLYLKAGGGYPVRVHGAFVSDDEVHRVVEMLRAQGEPNYIPGILEGGTLDDGGSLEGAGPGEGSEADPMYDQAVAIVMQHRKASISLVQRHLRIGYNRAARLLEQMEQSGIVSSMNTNGSRDLLVPKRDE